LEVGSDKSQHRADERYERRLGIFNDFLEDYPEVRNHKHRKLLVNAGVASHHAGHIPSWKLLVEKMMSAGLLDAIFATSTVAAGVDFPARTVVILNVDVRGNDGWRALQASELQQMTGRAGRRGKDKVGFVILAPSNFQDPIKVASLLKSSPDALESQFRATYTSLLNLLDAFKKFNQVREIAEKSFAFRDTGKQIDRLSRRRADLEREVISSNAELPDSVQLSHALGFERLHSVRNRLQGRSSVTRAELRLDWLRKQVLSGRVVTKGRNNDRHFIVLKVVDDRVLTMRDDGDGVNLTMAQIGKVFENRYRFDEQSLDHAFREAVEGSNPEIGEPKFDLKVAKSDASIELIDRLADELVEEIRGDRSKEEAEAILWGMAERASEITSIDRDVETLREGIWVPFQRRARVLSHFGYLDLEKEDVSESGKWLADLRVDRPLLVGEAISRGLFSSLDFQQAASFMASMASDPDRNFGELQLSDAMYDVINEFEEIAYDVSKIEWQEGVTPIPEVNLSAAAAAELWATGVTWSELVRRTGAEEGDLVRLMSRTGEALRQVGNLATAHPEIAKIAREASDAMLRDPIR